MSLRLIGPIALDATDWGEPKATWTSQPDASGMRGMSIEGVVDWTQAQQLSELVDNPDRSITSGGQAGVLEYVLFDDELLRPFTGWCLLQSADLAAERQWSLAGVGGPVPFSLKGVYLGDHREPVVVRTGRARANDFGLTPVAVAAEPFYGESLFAEGSPFAVDPAAVAPSANRQLIRDHDRRAYSLSDEEALSAKTLYLVDLNGAQDRTTIALSPRRNDAAVPSWARYRGGDVRAYDRSENREVYGPSHPFRAASDLAVVNGLLRVWVGARGLPPYLHVAAWRSNAWHEMGTVLLGQAGAAGGTLRGARLVRCTPDVATVALFVDTLGDIFVTLRRGERMLRIAHGADRPPLVSDARRAEWRGTPPGTLTNPVTAAGRFDNGLGVTSGGKLVFPWPPSVAVERWSVAGRWLPDAGASTHPDRTIAYVVSGEDVVGSLAYRASDRKLTLTLGGQSVEGPADSTDPGLAITTEGGDILTSEGGDILTTDAGAGLDFSAGQAIGWAARFSTDEGLVLSGNVADGEVFHASDPDAIDPGSTLAAYSSLALLGAP